MKYKKIKKDNKIWCIIDKYNVNKIQYNSVN